MGCMMATGIGEGIMDFGKKYIVEPIRNFSISDALDILILAAILYGVFIFAKGRRASKLALGLVFILIFYALSDIFHFRAVYQLLSGIAPFGIVLLAVIFQPEIRDALETLGSSPFGFLPGGSDRERSDLMNTISEVAEAACMVAQTKDDGALIVIECSTPLGDYANKGQPLDSLVSANLLANIFVNRSPLHDGAVLIRNNRIVSAGCKLPLTTNENEARGLGTRHRAAIGVSEVSDCVVVVVSEEKHIISVANAGILKREYNRNVDMHNDEAVKLVQNALRQDLFLLLAGMPLEKAEDKGKGKENSKDKGKGKGKKYFKAASKNGKKADGNDAKNDLNASNSPKAHQKTKKATLLKSNGAESAEIEDEGGETVERDKRIDVIPTPLTETEARDTGARKATDSSAKSEKPTEGA